MLAGDAALVADFLHNGRYADIRLTREELKAHLAAEIFQRKKNHIEGCRFDTFLLFLYFGCRNAVVIVVHRHFYNIGTVARISQ